MMRKLFFAAIILVTGLSCFTKKQLTKADLNLSSNHMHGYVDNRKVFDSLISVHTKQEIDSTKPLVLIFYPGQDSCNSSGSATRKSVRRWYNEMEKGIKKINPSNVFYIYKDSAGLYGRNDGFKQWYQDPDGKIEQQFFDVNPPCSGYAIIAKNGEFLSLSSEFGKESLWRDLRYLTN